MRNYLEKLLKHSLFSIFLVPLHQKGDWQVLKFDKIPANKVEFSENGMKVLVKNSSSPIIFPLDEVTSVSKVEISGKLVGSLKIPTTILQGEKGADDFALKLGLVIEGKNTLGPIKRVFAADWIKTLFDLAPKGMGVDRIQFYNAVSQKKLVGSERKHPLSELIHEKNVWEIRSDEEFFFAYNLTENLNVIAVWISIDGDDTGSHYSLFLTNLTLTTP